MKLRSQDRLDLGADDWSFRPVQGDLNATTGRPHMILEPVTSDELWPVYKGASFNLWMPDTAERYAFADPRLITEVLQRRRVASSRRRNSAFAELPHATVDDVSTLPCMHPRISYRRIARATDSRTLIAALVPPNVILTDKAAYLLRTTGDQTAEAYLIGVLSSIPLDWFARRIVEVQVDFHVINSFPIPRPVLDDSRRSRIVELSGRLAAVDDRYADWAEAVGVPVGSVSEEAKPELIAELDALVADLYGLERDDVIHIFETFHRGWDYEPRLEKVLGYFDAIGRG